MSKRPHVVMLLSNGYDPDVRTQKEAHTLALAGYRVTVIAWDRLLKFPRSATESIPPALDRALAGWEGCVPGEPEPVSIVRIQVSAGYRTGRRLLSKIPRYWWQAYREIRRLRPDIVHANDLDTLPVAVLYRRLTGVPVVYDAREYYPGMVQPNVGQRFSRILERLDGWLTPHADAVLTVGDRLKARMGSLQDRVWVVHNSQPLPDRAAIDAAGRAKRRAWGVPDEALLVVYVGYMTPDRLLAPLLEAVARLDDVWLAIGGTGPQLSTVQAAAESCPRMRVLGWVPLDEVASVVASGDVVYYGLDASFPNSYFFMPNLAFFALATGRPLLTTPVGEIAEVVGREECGLVMESASSEAALRALRDLRDPTRRDRLAARAAALGETEYTWAHAAEQLLAAYRSLGIAPAVFTEVY